jgi:hypothetical protein
VNQFKSAVQLLAVRSTEIGQHPAGVANDEFWRAIPVLPTATAAIAGSPAGPKRPEVIDRHAGRNLEEPPAVCSSVGEYNIHRTGDRVRAPPRDSDRRRVGDRRTESSSRSRATSHEHEQQPQRWFQCRKSHAAPPGPVLQAQMSSNSRACLARKSYVPISRRAPRMSNETQSGTASSIQYTTSTEDFLASQIESAPMCPGRNSRYPRELLPGLTTLNRRDS